MRADNARMKPWLAASITALLGAAPWQMSRAGPVTVFRCTADDGSVSLQDQPCAPDQREQRRSLPRPVDAPAAANPATPAPATTPSPPAPPVAASAPVATPQPLYDCVRHDGTHYESTSGIPQRQWVPLWVLGLDPRAQPDLRDVGRRRPPVRELPPGAGRMRTTGTWVEDRCTALSSDAICARRSERLDELRRGQYGAQQRDRERLRREAQALLEQLRRECGAG
jgi:hypothetical protein